MSSLPKPVGCLFRDPGPANSEGQQVKAFGTVGFRRREARNGRQFGRCTGGDHKAVKWSDADRRWTG